MHTNECIFLTGKAGTGKTTFLRRLQRECPKQMVVCAPTGVAAINAEGVTIHSLFQLPPQVFLPTDKQRNTLFREMRMNDRKLRLLRNLELLVIDEVSMVRSDLLDTIDATLRHFRRRYNQPFGGVQVLFIGDLYQLSPVAREEEWLPLREYYSGPYFFQAQVFSTLHPVYIELDKVYRQTNQTFIDILNQVRTNTLSAEGFRALNARYVPVFKGESGKDRGILLSTHNRKVDAINQRELDAISEPAFQFHADVKDNFPESVFPMDRTLTLKKGARVMFIKNDSSQEKAYYNGKLGTVVDIDQDDVFVYCDGDKEPIQVHTETWEHIRYVTDPDHNDELRAEVDGTFTQLPLRLAWAVTIHKAQGLTFDRVVIDAEDAFAAGQVYVALSRCRSLEGITLLSPIPSGALTNARDVLQFTGCQPTLGEVEKRLNPSEVKYFAQMLCTLYDFEQLRHQLDRVRKTVTSGDCFNQPDTNDFLNSLTNDVREWQQVARSFQNQIQGILSQPEPDYDFLGVRLKAAYGYFHPRMQALLEDVRQSPAQTANKAFGREYQQRLEEAYIDLARQVSIMAGIAASPSLKRYFDLRKCFDQPRINLSPLREKKSRNTTKAVKKTTRQTTQTKAGKNQFMQALVTLKHLLRGQSDEQQAVERGVPLQQVQRDIQFLVQQGMIDPEKHHLNKKM